MAEHHWKPPEGGEHWVAIPSKIYEARTAEIENFFSRPLAKWTHNMTRVKDRVSFLVFSFMLKEDADKFMLSFEGEVFDVRDRGGGQHWMFWYQGRTAKRLKNRSPYRIR